MTIGVLSLFTSYEKASLEVKEAEQKCITLLEKRKERSLNYKSITSVNDDVFKIYDS